MNNRIASIDYLRCVYIVLMVIFHLAYIGDKYPYIKQIVYTFHMPAFLIISGYLANPHKKQSDFIKSICWLFIPYAIMETGYIIMSTILPVREKIASLNGLLLLEKLFIHPIGPYWYLHTLIICYLIHYILNQLFPKIQQLSFIIVTALSFWGLSQLELISMANAIYFLLGVTIHRYSFKLSTFFQPCIYALIPLGILSCYESNLDRYSLSGICMTYLSISWLLGIYPHLSASFRTVCHYIGRNTLPILLFSPIFTILAKLMIPFLSFDSTGIIFTCLATAITICGSFLIAWSMDRLKLSPYFCHKQLLI